MYICIYAGRRALCSLKRALYTPKKSPIYTISTHFLNTHVATTCCFYNQCATTTCAQKLTIKRPFISMDGSLFFFFDVDIF